MYAGAVGADEHAVTAGRIIVQEAPETGDGFFDMSNSVSRRQPGEPELRARLSVREAARAEAE
jgi:hypothetical protein